MVWAFHDAAATPRVFVGPNEHHATEVEAGIASGLQARVGYFVLYQLSDGTELGRQVPCVILWDPSWKQQTYIIDERFVLESYVSRCEISENRLIIGFISESGNSSTEEYEVRYDTDVHCALLNGIGYERCKLMRAHQ
jgi:hypothetical protein